MNESIVLVLALVFGLLCVGGFVAALVLLVLWGVRGQRRWDEALRPTGFEPVTQLSPVLVGHLLAMAQLDERTHRVVCRHARREAGYTVLLQGVEPKDEVLATWQLRPAVHAPDLAIPRLTLVPKTVVGNRLAGWAARAAAWRSDGVLRLVPFSEDPFFDGLFEVLGAEENAVHDYLDGARRASLARMPGLTLVGDGDLFTFELYEKIHGATLRDEARLRYVVEDARSLLAILRS